jgi:hypothetical protein
MALDSAGMQGAGQGAQAGAMFGPWGMAIGAGVGFALGKKEGAEKAKQLKAAIEEHAKLMRQESARAQADIRRARSMEIANTSAALNYINRKSGHVKADTSVQNATADAIGASAQAVYSDADAKEAEAKATTMRGMEYNLTNLSAKLDSMLNSNSLQMRSAMDAFKKQDTSRQDMASGLLGLASAGGSMWAKGTFDKKTPPITDSTQSADTSYSATSYAAPDRAAVRGNSYTTF